LDETRLVQTARLEEDMMGALLGPGEQRGAAPRTELTGDLPAAVGDGGVSLDSTRDEPQSGGLYAHAHGVGAACGFLAVVTMTVAGVLGIANTFIPYVAT